MNEIKEYSFVNDVVKIMDSATKIIIEIENFNVSIYEDKTSIDVVN